MSTDDQSPTSFQTMRGRDYPILTQFTLFLENRVGQLRDLTRRLELAEIKIAGFSISDSAECAFVRLLVDQPERGREILEQAGLTIIESEIIAVELPLAKTPYFDVCTALLQGEINIIQAYPLLVQPHGAPVIALMVDNTEMALEALARKKYRTLTESDLTDEHYE